MIFASFNLSNTIRCEGRDAGQYATAHLYKLVPSGRDNDWILGIGTESNARYPLGVALVGDGEFTVSQGIPELDSPITRSGYDLTIVGGEGD